MRKILVLSTLILALLAGACGDNADTAVGADPGDAAPSDDTDQADQPDQPDTPAAPAPPADGPILGAGPYPIADLTITVTLDPDADPATYRLACLGDTATLSGDPVTQSADSMCLALNDSAVRDRVVNGEPRDQACTEIYGGPEVATATGALDGDSVDTEMHRNNGCGIADWDLLAALLPAI